MKPAKKTMSSVMKQDAKIDKAMTPKQMKADIKSDRALLAAKVKKGGRK